MVMKKIKKLQTDFTKTYYDFHKKLFLHTRSKIDSFDLCEDLVQQTFLKTWLYLIKGGKIDLMKAFLYHILNNIIVDEYRKHKTTSLDAIMEKGGEPRARDPGSSADYIDGKTAMRLINILPEKYKKIMQMRYIQNLSINEIHIITGQSKNSIAVQAHRGLEKLRLLYNKELKI